MSVQVERTLSRRSSQSARSHLTEKLAFGLLGLMMLLVIAPIVWLLGYIVYHGLAQVNWSFLTSYTLAGAKGGIFPAIVGTAYVMVGTVAIALPLGIAGAIYLTEYAGRGNAHAKGKGILVRLIRLAIVNLAGVPSIVHGLFGLGFFVYFLGGGIDTFILHTKRPVWGQPCLLWGFCTLAVVILPVIITATEEALLAVPRSFREGSIGLGATKWQTIRRVVLPTALPGILTGAILGIGRAAGETAPIMLTCAASLKADLPQGMNDQAMLLPYHLYFVVTQVENPPLQLQAGIALVLIAVVFAINIVAVVFRTRIRKARKW
jgi:phosphate transport system permease protein